jgi:hypothetical protein
MNSQPEQPRYANIVIEHVVDGTTIEGDETVKAYLEREQKMLAEYGTSIIFQVYRLNLQATTLKALQGEKLAEVKVAGSFVAATDSVAAVKSKLRSLLEELAVTQNEGQTLDALTLEAADRLTLYLSGRPLQDDTSFYDANYIVLPVWIQVLLHRCESEEAIQRINILQ